jgi:hypothetical protein
MRSADSELGMELVSLGFNGGHVFSTHDEVIMSSQFRELLFGSTTKKEISKCAALRGELENVPSRSTKRFVP